MTLRRKLLSHPLGWLLVLIVALLSLVLDTAQAETMQARVVGVSDGDTVTVLDGANKTHKVRLAGIDAPERAQPHGVRAKQALSELVFGREVSVFIVDRDRYGRVVARVYVGNVDVNAELVRSGMVWVYRRYNQDPFLPPLEEEARAQRRGLWADASPTPPWEFRREGRKARAEAR